MVFREKLILSWPPSPRSCDAADERFRGGEERDFLAAEEPLEIRVEDHSIAVVMRTPGEDHELAVAFS